MDFHLAVTGAFPALLAMWYVDRLDAKRPEPKSTLRKVAFAGALSTIPVIGIGLILEQLAPPAGTYEHAAYNGFVVAAAVEEAAKFLCVYWFVWHKPEFDERMDGIVYGARAGLGFALVENVLYLWQTASLQQFAFVYVARALLAVPGHAIWAGIIGYAAARRRFDGAGIGLLGGYLVAVGLHGLYDFAIFSSPILMAEGRQGMALGALGLPIVIIAGGWIALRKLARVAVARDDATLPT